MSSSKNYPNQFAKTVLLIFIALLTSIAAYSQVPNTWTQKANFGGGDRSSPIGFSIGSKGYIGTGYGNGFSNDLWEYDPSTNVWTQKANFAGAARENAVAFSIGNNGYVGTGYSFSGYYKDFWEYNSISNTWTQKADFGGTARYFAVGFAIGNKGYIGTGWDGTYKKDFWEYDPSTNIWTQKADFVGTARHTPFGFSIGSYGYVGTGYDGTNTKDFWRYDPASDTWIQKADFGGTARQAARGFSIGSNGYVTTGNDGVLRKDCWEYNSVADQWIQKTDFGGAARWYATSFSIYNKGYVGNGIDYPTRFHDFWEYTPDDVECEVPTNLSSTILTSSKVHLKWDEVAEAEKYKLRYRVTGTNEWTIKNPVAHSKTITGLLPNTDYEWQVKTYCQATAPRVTSDWSDKHYFTTDPLRSGTEIINPSFNVYPNPFSNYTTISFSVPKAIHATIELYDLAGRKLQTVLDENTAAGNHELDLNRDQLTAGIYFLKLRVSENEVMKKLIIQ